MLVSIQTFNSVEIPCFVQNDSVQIDKRRNIIVFVDSLFNMLNELNGQFEWLNLSLIRIFQVINLESNRAVLGQNGRPIAGGGRIGLWAY